MEKVQVTLDLPKESFELAEGIKKLALSLKEHMKDGFQPITDVPAVVMENLNSMGAALAGIDKIKEEKDEAMASVIKAFALAGADIAEAFLKKAEEPQA